MEIWKEINGFESYFVSNFGNVKHILKNGKERILKQEKHYKGYLRVVIGSKNNKKRFFVHRLVASAFISNPYNKPQVDHINTIRTDNRAENLRWVTQEENMDNPLTKEKTKSSFKDRKVAQYDLDGNLIKIWNSIKEAQNELKIAHHISEVCSGKLKSCGGFIWKYID